MGGSLILKYIRTGLPKYPNDYETDEVFEDQVDGVDTWWAYRYSGFMTFKGQILRGGIAYLAHLQTTAKEKELAPEGAKQFFLDAGIKAVVGAKNDEAAVKAASGLIDKALQILNDWKREQRNTDSLALFTAISGGSFPSRGMDIEALVDVPYHLMKIMGLAECPIALERVGMRGLYFLMRLSDNDQLVYHEAAQMMGSVVERIMEQGKTLLADADDAECFEEMSTEFSQFMKLCKEGTYIQG